MSPARAIVAASGPAGPHEEVTTMSLTRVTSSSDVVELATGLLDPRRELPWGVISIPVAAETPLIDVEQLVDEAGDVCRFFVIQTGTLTRELDAMLPDRCQVYGGASRIYPVGTQWTIQPEQSPLRFAHDTKAAAIVVDTLVTDALAMAKLAGLFAKPASTSVRASGEVRSLLAGGTRAFVELDTGGFATIVHELTFPHIPLEWVIREEQRVDGLYDPRTKRLALDVVRVAASELLEHYPHGTVTLAFVVSVERQSGVLAVHPSLPITVARADVSSNSRDRVDLLLAPGDVVRVRVVRDAQGRTRLRLNDLDDDETIQPALALVTGGDPWLEEDRHKPEPAPRAEVRLEAEIPSALETPAPAAPTSSDSPDLSENLPAAVLRPRPAPGLHQPQSAAPGPPAPPSLPAAVSTKRQSAALISTQLALAQERDRIRQLEEQLKHMGGEGAIEKVAIMRLELGELHAENRRIHDQLHKTRSDQQTQRTLLRKARQADTTPKLSDRRERFDDAEEWMRHEIYLAWVNRMDAVDRRLWPLPPEYTVGEHFAPSLEQLGSQSHDKALKAVVDVLTGRARELPTRAPHPLRSGDGMAAADVVRADGARCMRVHIEKNVAAARRLHYWQRDDGDIELSRLVLHDDMEP
jgi:hypothetical protein